MNRFVLLIALLVAPSACAGRSSPPVTAPSGTAATHENLNAVLWMQTSVEFEATALQAYRLARLQLDAALANPKWTAALEQHGDYSRLPPAVIVDVDETVLDNSYYQARLVRDNAVFATPTWDAWVAEGRATAIPGALDFSQYAATKGVTIFYVSNRTANLEESTRRNLTALGFPLTDGVDTVLVRGERPEWSASAKGPRRQFVATNYRIVMLIGDDLGDFVVDASGTAAERHARAAPQAAWWGVRWIMIPNPTYGSWERALIGTSRDPIAARRAALKFQRPDR